MLILILSQFLFGNLSLLQTDQTNSFLLANRLVQIVESDTQYSSDVIDLTKELRDIFNSTIQVEADETLIRILKFENAILFEKSKPLFQPIDVLMIKKKIPGKDIESAKRRALALIKLGLAKSRN